MPLGALSTLGAGGAAGVLVVRVDAEPGLDHHYAVVMPVAAVLICETDHEGVGCHIYPRYVLKILCSHTHTGGYLTPAGRRESCCTVAPGPAWRWRRSLGCAFCLPSGTAPPSFAGPFRRRASTARAQDSSQTLSQTHEICIVVKNLQRFPLCVAAACSLSPRSTLW